MAGSSKQRLATENRSCRRLSRPVKHGGLKIFLPSKGFGRPVGKACHTAAPRCPNPVPGVQRPPALARTPLGAGEGGGAAWQGPGLPRCQPTPRPWAGGCCLRGRTVWDTYPRGAVWEGVRGSLCPQAPGLPLGPPPSHGPHRGRFPAGAGAAGRGRGGVKGAWSPAGHLRGRPPLRLCPPGYFHALPLPPWAPTLF